MMSKMKTSLKLSKDFCVKNELRLLSLSGLSFLGLAWLNLSQGSLAVGVVAFAGFVAPVSVLAGHVFFKEQKTIFKIVFGFATMLAILSLFGTLTYLFVDYTWPPMMVFLGLVPVLLLVWDERTKQPMERCKGVSKQRAITALNRWLVMDIVFFLLSVLSLYAVYLGRTGESIKTFWDFINPTLFFLPFFGAACIAVFATVNHKISHKRTLLYITVLALVVALIPIVFLRFPQTHMMGDNIGWTREFNQFGMFISAPGQIERASGPIHKQFEFVGYDTIMVTLSRLLNVDPAVFDILLTPIMFAFYIPLSAYVLIRTILPKVPQAASMGAIAGLISQHIIFLLFPPGKPETLALVFLLFSCLFWTAYLVRKNVSIFVPLLFSFATVFIHPNVGVFALAAVSISAYLHIMRPYDQSGRNTVFVRLTKFGYIVLTIALSMSLILAYYLSNFLRLTQFQVSPIIDLGEWLKVIFPSFVQPQVLVSFEGIRDLYLNNFTYIWYLFVFIGGLLSVRWNSNRKYMWLIVPLVFLSLASMMVQQFFFTTSWAREYYRFFYYLTFITFPLVGLSLYGLTEFLTSKIKWKPTQKTREKLQFNFSKTSIMTQAMTLVMTALLAIMIVASVYGGFPRAGSLGPYDGSAAIAISEHDVAAMNFISNAESRFDRKFFIVGDSDTAGAALLKFGHKVYNIDGRFQSFVSYGSDQGRKAWSEIVSNPSPQALDNALDTMKADILYIVITYRLGDQLEPIAQAYSRFMLKPVLSTPGVIYVFEYTSATLRGYYPISVDGQEKSKFWKVVKIGTGSIDATISDDSNERICDDSSLLINVTQGSYARFNLFHDFPIHQDWSSYDFISLYWYGNSSNIRVNLVAAVTQTDLFVTQIIDNFTGWSRLVLPLDTFQKAGEADWSNISSVWLQFLNSSVPLSPNLVTRIDRMAVLALESTSIVHSELEDRAVAFIQSKEEGLNSHFLILGDPRIASALQSISGNYSNWAYYPPLWETQFFLEPFNDIEAEGIDRIYLILSTRTHYITINSTAQAFLGDPLFVSGQSIYVYRYSPPTLVAHIFGHDQPDFWVPIGWGNGIISVPKTSWQKDSDFNGTYYLQLSVGTGDFANWGLEHMYLQTLNWSNFRFFCFWWNGHSGGSTINVYAQLPDPNNVAIATVKEDWTGWRRLMIPFSSFQASGNPSWSSVKYLRIGLYSSQKGTWQLPSVDIES